uniref:Major facilitator superfamily (MFS) profile domain-containing protein n=1 Tax=Meloidogyne enterolobii TaxID=390850 RepID=A0A6V7U558_MELEN|nr:unnamed protein product [Meloidogyne enterolobii]
MLKFLFPPNGRLLQTCIFSCIISFLNLFFQSYSTFYTNTAAENIQKYINDSYLARGQKISENYLLWFWNFVLNLPFLGFLLSNLLAPYFCESFGRRATLIYTNVASFISALLTTISIIYLIPELFLISRVFGSAVTNINFCAFTLFATEFPATKYRGLAVYIGGLNFNLGGNIGMILGMDVFLGKNLVYLTGKKVILIKKFSFNFKGIALLPTFLAFLLLFPIKETPKFLYLKRQDKKAMVEALKFYQGDKFDHEEFLHELEEERQDNDNSDDKTPIFQILKEIFTQKHLLLASILSAASLQLNIGPWPVATTLLSFHFDIEKAQFFATFGAFCSLMVTLPGIFMSERVSRRLLLLLPGLTSVLSLISYLIFDRLTLFDGIFRYGCAFSFIVYFCCFGIALGIIPYYIAGELFPQNFRSTGQAIVFFTFFLLAFVFNTLTLPLYASIGVWCFLPLFIIPQIFCLIILWIFLPETRGREVHEIVEDLKKLNLMGSKE